MSSIRADNLYNIAHKAYLSTEGITTETEALLYALAVMLDAALPEENEVSSEKGAGLLFDARTLYNKLHDAGNNIDYLDERSFDTLNRTLSQLRLREDDLEQFVEWFTHQYTPYAYTRKWQTSWEHLVNKFPKWLDMARKWDHAPTHDLVEDFR